ncbi:hypothetical protein AKJ09_03631 [Labilithrix luteola]|uniref:HutD family protein n=1 Tax=Labilithrix luteola TaxID=1391654 RepID=A0A0K1PTX2_9BACT|nr:HutD family protein [Labilithrix luteola]AKU96967.1 hypothetical protein AKJ09_03631 [Labilithrix luteola]
MRRLRSTDYRRMPWKNGGGTTTEIAIEPKEAGLAGERFLWRVSIADVASDGPFSRFEGYDRHIMLLEGAGMTLDAGAHGRFTLAPLVPQTFSGDWDVTGTLTAGAVRDFNLMVDRARASSTLEVVHIEQPMQLSVANEETCIAHILEGRLSEADASDTLILDSEAVLTPIGSTRLAIGRITRM